VPPLRSTPCAWMVAPQNSGALGMGTEWMAGAPGPLQVRALQRNIDAGSRRSSPAWEGPQPKPGSCTLLGAIERSRKVSAPGAMDPHWKVAPGTATANPALPKDGRLLAGQGRIESAGAVPRRSVTAAGWLQHCAAAKPVEAARAARTRPLVAARSRKVDPRSENESRSFLPMNA
jgi:hypothetical protein